MPTRRTPSYGVTQRSAGMGVLRLQRAVDLGVLVLDLVGTEGIYTDTGATVPAVVTDPVAAWRD